MYARLTNLEPSDDKYSFTDEDARKWKRFRIMREMGWNYWEYENTPAHIIDEIWAFILTEIKAMSDKNG